MTHWVQAALLAALLALAPGCQPQCYADPDGDGYGGDELACRYGGVEASGDCNDLDPSRHAGATERCDGVDQDCDGVVDNAASDALVWYIDADGDGVGDRQAVVVACTVPGDGVAVPGDCDDGDADLFPGADERCDGRDEDCDGLVDEAAEDALSWYGDVDGDGYGAGLVLAVACEGPAGMTSTAGDCDDSDPLVSPMGTETCDGRDEDCDFAIDEDGAVDADIWFADSDGDGFGDPATPQSACVQPVSFVLNADDCDDTRFDVHPGGVEVCDNELDDDCDGGVDLAPCR